MATKKQQVKTKDTKQEKVGSQVVRGRVVAVKMPKTVTVLVGREKVHPLYGKAFKRSKRYLVHDEMGVSLGDIVEIVKTKPVSKNKHFRIKGVVGKDLVAVASEKLKEEAAEAIAEVMPEEEESRIESLESSKENVKEEKSKKKASKKEEKT